MNATKPQGASPATRKTILAALRADPGISPAHRARVLAALDASPGIPVEVPPGGWAPASVVARDLGLELSTLIRWCESGKVKSRRIGERRTIVDREEVAAFAAANPGRRKRQP